MQHNMTPYEKFNGTTENGCREVLNTLSGIAGEVTVGSLRAYLENRMAEAQKEVARLREEMREQLTGNYFKIRYSDDHFELVHVIETWVDEKWFFQTAISAEVIKVYKGDIGMDVYSLKDDRPKYWENHWIDHKKLPPRASRHTFEEMKQLYLTQKQKFDETFRDVPTHR